MVGNEEFDNTLDSRYIRELRERIDPLEYLRFKSNDRVFLAIRTFSSQVDLVKDLEPMVEMFDFDDVFGLDEVYVIADEDHRTIPPKILESIMERRKEKEEEFLERYSHLLTSPYTSKEFVDSEDPLGLLRLILYVPMSTEEFVSEPLASSLARARHIAEDISILYVKLDDGYERITRDDLSLLTERTPTDTSAEGAEFTTGPDRQGEAQEENGGGKEERPAKDQEEEEKEDDTRGAGAIDVWEEGADEGGEETEVTKEKVTPEEVEGKMEWETDRDSDRDSDRETERKIEIGKGLGVDPEDAILKRAADRTKGLGEDGGVPDGFPAYALKERGPAKDIGKKIIEEVIKEHEGFYREHEDRLGKIEDMLEELQRKYGLGEERREEAEKKLNEQDIRIEEIWEMAEELHGRTVELEKRAGQLEKVSVRTEERTKEREEIYEEWRTRLGEFEERIDEVESRFEEYDRRSVELEETAEEIADRLADLEKRSMGYEESKAEHDSILEDMDGRVLEYEKRVRYLEEGYQEYPGLFLEWDQSFDEWEGQLDEYGGRLDKLEKVLGEFWKGYGKRGRGSEAGEVRFRGEMKKFPKYSIKGTDREKRELLEKMSKSKKRETDEIDMGTVGRGEKDNTDEMERQIFQPEGDEVKVEEIREDEAEDTLKKNVRKGGVIRDDGAGAEVNIKVEKGEGKGPGKTAEVTKGGARGAGRGTEAVSEGENGTGAARDEDEETFYIDITPEGSKDAIKGKENRNGKTPEKGRVEPPRVILPREDGGPGEKRAELHRRNDTPEEDTKEEILLIKETILSKLREDGVMYVETEMDGADIRVLREDGSNILVSYEEMGDLRDVRKLGERVKNNNASLGIMLARRFSYAAMLYVVGKDLEIVELDNFLKEGFTFEFSG